jgi:putative ABC transport system ATP-binding protein
MPALELDQVRKEYPMGDATVVALDDANLHVDADELVALVGPSGSGKSTALSIAGALLPPTGGSVAVGGTALAAMSQRQRTAFRRARVGFVFQAANLVPYLTARENLLVVADGPRRQVRRRADTLLDELGLGERANTIVTRLSGGERQRVATARALMNTPDLLLVDEPTSALDTERGRQVMHMLRDEIKHRGTAGVVVTHDTRMVDVCDRIVHIRDGRIDDANQPAAGTPHPPHEQVAS